MIDLRREELDIKAADVERKAEEAEKRFGLDQERLDTQRELSEERNDIQVDIAEMKDQTAQDRLKLQQAVQMGNLAEKMTKNFSELIMTNKVEKDGFTIKDQGEWTMQRLSKSPPMRLQNPVWEKVKQEAVVQH